MLELIYGDSEKEYSKEFKEVFKIFEKELEKQNEEMPKADETPAE